VIETAEFERNGRKARVIFVRDGGYEVYKTDPKSFNGYRTSQYSTKAKAIAAAKNFIRKSVLWTKGRSESTVYVQLNHDQRMNGT
jgi:hypothetical protein